MQRQFNRGTFASLTFNGEEETSGTLQPGGTAAPQPGLSAGGTRVDTLLPGQSRTNPLSPGSTRVG